MTILTLNRKEFEKKVGNGKAYKPSMLFSINMFPGDLSRSPDDFCFYNKETLWKIL